MEILIGVLISTTAWLLIDKFKTNKPLVVRNETEEERIEREKSEKHIQAIMNYNPEKAVRHHE